MFIRTKMRNKSFHCTIEPVGVTVWWRLFCRVAAILISLSAGSEVSAIEDADETAASSHTVPGTVIENRAELTYVNSDTGETILVKSNLATIAVGFYYSFSIESNRSVNAQTGEVVELAHRISNTGNTPDHYELSDFFPDSEGRLADITIYHDLNRNGIVDAGEPEIEQALSLDAGRSIDLVMRGTVPDNATIGTTLRVGVSAKSGGSAGETRSNVDEVVVVTGAFLALQKTSSPQCGIALFPDDVVSHSVDIVNTGASNPHGIRIILDGELRTGIVVELVVPLHMVFDEFLSISSHNTGAIPVLRLQGVAANSWVRAESRSGDAPVASAGLFFEPEQLPQNAREAFTVALKVSDISGTNNLVTSSASVDLNGDAVPDHKSNNTCSTLSIPGAALAASLRFLEPVSTLLLAGSAPEFNEDDHFIDAIQYRLNGVGNEDYVAHRDGFYLELELSALDNASVQIDATGNRYAVAVVESELTGDSINVVLLETTTAGFYRSVAPVELSMNRRSDGGYCAQQPSDTDVVTPVIDGDNPGCVLQSGPDDKLQGRFLDSNSGLAIADVALVHPQGLVFNSQTLLPVSGALVSIYDESKGVVALSSVTGLPLESTTGADGLYTLPRLLPGIGYFLVVTPPAQHLFPSLVSAGQLPDFNVNEFSYGAGGSAGAPTARASANENNSGSGVFRLRADTVFFPVDIPLDSNISEALLSIEKTALQQFVEPGQSVAYSVVVKNNDTSDLTAVVLQDRPPYGYRYVPLSSTLGDEEFSEPAIDDNGLLEFSIGTLGAGESVTLVYILRSSAGAIDSDGVNSAIALGVTAGNAQVVSPVSRARVKLQRNGVLSDRAAVFGKIYVDQNCDHVQNNKEWPVGGVKLYLQDGTYTISDGDGLFSIYGLRPGSHVIKVDTHTLPDGLQLKPLDSLQGVDPESRFVDLMQGDFYRVDFAAICPQEHIDLVFAEIVARNQSINGSWLLKGAENFRAGEEQLQLNPEVRVRSVDGDLSSGILAGPEKQETSVEGVVARRVAEELAKKKDADALVMPVAQEVVAEITKEQAKAGTWLWPQGELSINGRFMAVVRDGIDPTLYVNGEAVPSTQIGERMVNRREKAQVVAWYGVELDSGESSVEVKGTDPFGNERVLASGTFKRPSSGTSIRVTAERDVVQADGGRSILPVNIEILDAMGYPALGVYFITLESSDGSWVEQDIQDSEPGRQIRVNNGSRVVNFVSSESTGKILLRASTGEFSDEITVHQVSESRPLIATGFIEAGAAVSSTSFGSFAPSRDLGSLNGSSQFNTRAALFVKGRVKNKYNLTFSYDSDKDSREQLLRDINPSAYYPIHGDASIRGYEAQSRSKLYLKLERDKNSLMWGDFLTDSDSDHHDLARSRRVFTGLNTVYDDGQNRIRFYAAEQEDRRLTEEVPGNGSALLFRLRSFPIVPNSEVVEIITRSRENTGLVIGETRLSRFGDYNIDPIDGFVTFSSVIPTLDDQQNPVFVRISYDVENGGDDYLVSGVRFDRSATENLKFGVSYTSDSHSEDGNKLAGAYASYEVDKRTRVTASIASSDSIQSGTGNARQLSVEHSWGGKSEARTTLSHARADSAFFNSGAAVAAGRSETRVNHKQKVFRDTTLFLDAIESDSTDSGEGRRTLGAVLETRLREWLLRAGLRQITQEDFSSRDQFVTSVLGAGRKINIGDKLGRVDAEYEQDTGKGSRRRVTLGAKLQVHEKVHVYSNYELANSLLALNGGSNNQRSEALTLGIETSVLPSTRLFSEYRMRGAFDSRDYETASGVRADYEIAENLKVTPTIEVIRSIDADDNNNDSLAASIAVVDTRNPNSRRLMRLETRSTDGSDYVGFRASYAARLNQDWTAVLTENLSRQFNRSSVDTLRHSFVAGLTRRPKLDNRHHMLFMYNWKEERGITTGGDRTVHLLSTHQNLQLNNRALLTGRLGGKLNTSRLMNRSSTSFALLADVRLNFDFNRRMNIDFRGGLLATEGAAETRYSAGAGLYYLISKNARIGIGYNVVGFRDPDLDAEEYNAHGWHIGLQYKFDEDSLKWLE